ncbi:hypothetical protein [Aequorivita sinensis]|uniref:hypothetical protein n=1 Tax=Aequorivita sinensis TaxID=1382458 RepID=UPI0011205FD2|nr:hypothetical protein [Aequorivita sinensis]
MKPFKKEDVHPLAINIQKLQRYNYEYFNCEEVVFFEYIVVKGMAFKKIEEFFHSSETIRQETGIKKHSLNSIIKKFENLGIISIEVKGMPRVKHFKVHFPRIVELIPNIYQLSESSKLYPNFSKHLSDYFLPLVENYQKKNSNKNNKNNNNLTHTNIELDNERQSCENLIMSFNNFLSSLKYKKNISPAALKFNEMDLYRALKNYDIEIICEYIQQFFNEKSNATLSNFFAFDEIAFNKLKFIEQKIADENEFVEKFLETLQNVYDDRVELYNEDEENDITIPETQLVITARIKILLKFALKYRSELQIKNAFIAYIDAIHNDQLTVSKILPYFLSTKNDEYEIIDKYLEIYTLNYTNSKYY